MGQVIPQPGSKRKNWWTFIDYAAALRALQVHCGDVETSPPDKVGVCVYALRHCCLGTKAGVY